MRRIRKHLHDETVIGAIREAEMATTGHIRVLVSHKAVDDPVRAAQAEFVRMGLAKYPEHNGVLIFVAPHSRNFAVVGDSAVHAKCGEQCWAELSDAMGGYFRKHDFTAGVVHGIHRAGKLLAEHFPKSAN